jgi:hypothetical protein
VTFAIGPRGLYVLAGLEQSGSASMVQKQPEVTSHLVAEHGLKPDEYDRILKLIGRPPSFTELGIFSAMWNERGVDREQLGRT